MRGLSTAAAVRSPNRPGRGARSGRPAGAAAHGGVPPRSNIDGVMVRSSIRIVLLLSASIGLGACAQLRGIERERVDPEQELRTALAEWRRGEHSAASDRLQRIHTGYRDRGIGRSALLARAAVALDPRDADRDLDRGARLAAEYLRLEDGSPATEPIAGVLYLLALELGAEPVPAPDSLPTLAQPSLAEVIEALTAERDSARAQLAATQQQLAERERQLSAVQKQLAERDRELERIRKTLKH